MKQRLMTKCTQFTTPTKFTVLNRRKF